MVYCKYLGYNYISNKLDVNQVICCVKYINISGFLRRGIVDV